MPIAHARLLILNYDYPPLGESAGRCAKYQAEGLARLGYDVTVITTWFRGETEIDEFDHLKLIRLKSWRRKDSRSNPLERISWALKTLRYIKKNKLYLETDLVLAHFALPGGLVALPINLFHKIPYYIVSHGQDIPWFSPKKRFLYHLVFYLPIRWICSRASKITVLSQKRLDDLKGITARKLWSKNLIIPNGCDIDFFTPPENEKEKEILRILFVGKLTTQKDPLTLLETLHFLSATLTPFSLEILGDGPLRRKMESYVKNHHLDRFVRFRGLVSREKLREKYKSAHMLINTSREADLSLEMIEAIASGLYVFTTRVGRSDGLIQEGVNGEYIPFGLPLVIAPRIEDYYKEKVLKNYRIPVRKLKELRETISWDQYVSAYDRIIRE